MQKEGFGAIVKNGTCMQEGLDAIENNVIYDLVPEIKAIPGEESEAEKKRILQIMWRGIKTEEEQELVNALSKDEWEKYMNGLYGAVKTDLRLSPNFDITEIFHEYVKEQEEAYLAK